MRVCLIQGYASSLYLGLDCHLILVMKYIAEKSYQEKKSFIHLSLWLSG